MKKAFALLLLGFSGALFCQAGLARPGDVSVVSSPLGEDRIEFLCSSLSRPVSRIDWTIDRIPAEEHASLTASATFSEVTGVGVLVIEGLERGQTVQPQCLATMADGTEVIGRSKPVSINHPSAQARQKRRSRLPAIPAEYSSP